MFEALKATLMLTDQQRLVGTFAITRHLNVHGTFVGEHGLAADTAALIGLARWLWPTALVSQMRGLGYYRFR